MMRRIAALALACGLLFASSGTAAAANVVNFHHPVTGAAELFASTCTFAEDPPFESECLDTFVLYLQSAGGNAAARRQPWIVIVDEFRWVLHADGTPEDLSHRFGFLEDPTGHVDTARMLSAAVSGSVPMDDGSTYHLDLTWDMTGTEQHVAGIDGPIQEEGVPWGSHSVDACVTANFFAHQRWRWEGSIEGTLDGVSVDSLFLPPGEPFIEGRSVFTITITEHGPRC